MANYYLNVILHGLTTIVVPKSGGISILLPFKADMDKPGQKGKMNHQNDHIYEWEPWGKDRSPIVNDGTTHYFAGLASATPTQVYDLDPDWNIVMENCRVIPPGDASLYCTINLPFPNKIYPMRKVCKKPWTDDFLSGDVTSSLAQAPSLVSMVHAFRYRIDDPNNVTYGGNRLLINEVNTDLHIWADPFDGSHVMTEEEIQQEGTPFQRMVKWVTGMECIQSSHYDNRSGELDEVKAKSEMPPGMDFTELYNRSERSRFSCPPKHDCSFEEPHKGESKIVHCISMFVFDPPNL
jgi:hypothetical protein